MRLLFLWIKYFIYLIVNAFGELLNLTVGKITKKNYNNPESMVMVIILLIIVIIIYFTIKRLFYMKYR
ncbi:MAG: hypothetical protein AB1765_03980 [Candidatus Hydrogenedentota bacterium]